MKATLSDVCNIIAGYAFKGKDFNGDGYPVIKITDIQPPYASTISCSHVNLSSYDTSKLTKYLVSRNDFVIAMTGATIGKIGRITSGQAYINQRVAKFEINDSTTKAFVYQLLLSDSFTTHINSNIDSQSAQPNISAGSIGRFEFDLPTKDQQRHIVDILGTLDEKIENNRLIQQGLIAYGLKIFENRSRQSKTDHSFGELFSFINGFSFKSSDYKETGKYKVITIKNITDNGFNSDNADKIDYSDSFAKSRLSIGDILLTMTGEVGRVGIVDIDNALLNQRVLKVVGKSSFFTYFALLSNSNNIKTLAKGSVQQNLGLKELSKYLIACDNVESYKQYDWIITKLLSISKENKSLNALKQLYLKKFFG